MRRPFAGHRAEGGSRGQHLGHDLLLGLGLEPDVQEAGAGDLDGGDPLTKGTGLQQRRAQHFGHLARIALERLGQLHGRGTGEVAVGRDLGRLEQRLVAGAGGKLFQLRGQAAEQFLFDEEHAAILRGRACSPVGWARADPVMLEPSTLVEMP